MQGQAKLLYSSILLHWITVKKNQLNLLIVIIKKSFTDIRPFNIQSFFSQRFYCRIQYSEGRWAVILHRVTKRQKPSQPVTTICTIVHMFSVHIKHELKLYELEVLISAQTFTCLGCRYGGWVLQGWGGGLEYSFQQHNMVVHCTNEEKTGTKIDSAQELLHGRK